MKKWKLAIGTGLGLAVFGFAVGMPLLAWGISDWRGFLLIPVRAIYSVTVALQAALLGVGYALLPFTTLPSKQRGQAGKRVGRQPQMPQISRMKEGSNHSLRAWKPLAGLKRPSQPPPIFIEYGGGDRQAGGVRSSPLPSALAPLPKWERGRGQKVGGTYRLTKGR